MRHPGIYPRSGWRQLGSTRHLWRPGRDAEGFLHVIQAHRNPAGAWCYGHVSTNPADNPHWTLLSEEPLTLSPSLQCRSCPNHGHIVNGRWEPVKTVP